MSDTPLHDALSPHDQRVLDMLVESGFDESALDGMPQADRTRAARLLCLLGLMRDYPVQDGTETLVHATLARIDQADREQARRMRAAPQEMAETMPGGSLRWSNLISAAAIVLIGASIVIPIIQNLRQQGMMLKSHNNLRYVMQAVDSYAGDYGTIPSARAGLGETVESFADAINLTPLVQSDYCRLIRPDGDRKAARQQRQADRQRALVLMLGNEHPVLEAVRDGRPAHIRVMEGDGAHRNLLQDDSAILWLEQGQLERPMPETVFWHPRMIMRLSDDIRPGSRLD